MKSTVNLQVQSSTLAQTQGHDCPWPDSFSILAVRYSQLANLRCRAFVVFLLFKTKNNNVINFSHLDVEMSDNA